MNVPPRLHAYREAGAIGRDDIAAAALLVEMARRDGAAEPELLAWVGMCLALRTVRDGHTCVDLSEIARWAGETEAMVSAGLEWPTAATAWIEPLEKAAARMRYTALSAQQTIISRIAADKFGNNFI